MPSKVKSRYATGVEEGPELWKIRILDSLRNVVKQFKREYGSVVIATDSPNYWRREFFPYYKSKRKAARNAVPIDWTAAFAMQKEVLADLEASFGYSVVRADRAEADDVIAVLTKQAVARGEPVMIVARDGDFWQLHALPNVYQHDQNNGETYRKSNPAALKLDHILCGDTIDGIPNVMSDDDTYVNPAKRSKAMRAERMAELLVQMKEHGSLENPVYNRNLVRNTRLIDLDHIPEDVEQNIITAYDISHAKCKRNVLEYCMRNKLKGLISVIGDF